VEERVRQLGAELADARDAAWDTAQRGAELEESLDISHQEADMLRAQLDTMVPPEEVELLQSRLDEQEALVSQVLEEAAESQQELDFLRAESERHHLASATRVRALEAEVAEFKALNDELSSHMDELVAAMEEQNATNARLRERLSAVPDVEQLREGLSRAEERAAQLSSEVEVVTSVAENLRAREAEVTEEGAAATARAEALASELAAAKLREEELEELVAALEEENPAATPSRSRTEGQLRHRLEHLERELEREQAAGEEARSLLQAKSQQLQAANDELDAAQKTSQSNDSLAYLESERAALKDELLLQREAVDEAAGELAGMVEVNLQLQEEVATLKRRAEASESRESRLESELTKLAGQHNISQRIHHMQKVKEENALLRAEVVQVREELRRVQHRCHLLQESQAGAVRSAHNSQQPPRSGGSGKRTPIVWQPPPKPADESEADP